MIETVKGILIAGEKCYVVNNSLHGWKSIWQTGQAQDLRGSKNARTG